MGLNYKWTCPEIDSKIEYFDEYLITILEDTFPEYKESFIKDLKNDILTQFKDLAEDLRRCNSNLRDEAENQIKELEDEISELNCVIEELQK